MRLTSPALITVVALAIAAPHGVHAQEAAATPSPKKWTIDDVLAIKGVGGVSISPDGKRVAYVVSSDDRETDLSKSDIWIVSIDGGAPIQVTHGPRSDRSPKWAPDGSWFAFLSNRGENKKWQVYGIDPSGGEAWPVTKHETSVGDFELSPNGQRIAFLASAPATKAEQDQEKDRGKPIVRDSAYSTEWTRLWTAPLKDRVAGEAKASSPDGMDVTSVVWGPDSRTIAWGAKPSPLIRSYELGSVYVQSEPGAEIRRLAQLPGGVDAVAWPNDPGLIVTAPGKLHTADNEQLWLAPLTAEAPVSLTAGLDENARYVAASTTELLVEADVRTGHALYRIPLASGRPAGPPQRLTDSTRYYSGFSKARSAATIAFLAESPSQPPDVNVSALASFAPKRLTNVNPQVAAFAYGERRVVSWKSKADSETIEGTLTLPVGYQQGTKVPLLLVIHGGPSGVSSNRFDVRRGAYATGVFTGMGYAVLQPNYRGSTGYGQRFRNLNRGDISGKDWIDVNSGVDAMIRMGIADSAKLGIMGWSFGGHHTYWGITHTTRFAAASAGAGANDLISMYSQTDIPEFYDTYLGPRPWENFELYQERSAYRFVKNVTTPLLIQVGENDRRVPAEQSIQFYEAVKGIGKVPVKLVMYPGQPHGVNDPRLVKDLLSRNVQWFTYWIPVTGAKPPVRVASEK